VAVAPQVIHGYGALPVPREQQTSGGLPFGEVTMPFLDYKVPTVAFIAFCVLMLFLLHLMGFTFVGVVSVASSAR
jgi:hypothetical protein